MKQESPSSTLGAATATSPALLALRGLRREFPAGEGTIAVLQDIDLDIRAGEMVAIVGQSGSGKSTLMNILGCLDRPTSGSYRVAGRETHALDADALAALRRGHFGFIFQRYHLLGDLTARGNVEVPAMYAGVPMNASPSPPCDSTRAAMPKSITRGMFALSSRTLCGLRSR